MTIEELFGVNNTIPAMTPDEAEWILDRLEANKITPHERLNIRQLNRITKGEEMLNAAIKSGNMQFLYATIQHLMYSCNLTGKTKDWEHFAADCLDDLKYQLKKKAEVRQNNPQNNP